MEEEENPDDAALLETWANSWSLALIPLLLAFPWIDIAIDIDVGICHPQLVEIFVESLFLFSLPLSYHKNRERNDLFSFFFVSFKWILFNLKWVWYVMSKKKKTNVYCKTEISKEMKLIWMSFMFYVWWIYTNKISVERSRRRD